MRFIDNIAAGFEAIGDRSAALYHVFKYPLFIVALITILFCLTGCE